MTLHVHKHRHGHPRRVIARTVDSSVKCRKKTSSSQYRLWPLDGAASWVRHCCGSTRKQLLSPLTQYHTASVLIYRPKGPFAVSAHRYMAAAQYHYCPPKWASPARKGGERPHSPVRSRTRALGAASHMRVIPVTWTLGSLGSKTPVDTTISFTPPHLNQQSGLYAGRSVSSFLIHVAVDVGVAGVCRYVCVR